MLEWLLVAVAVVASTLVFSYPLVLSLCVPSQFSLSPPFLFVPVLFSLPLLFLSFLSPLAVP